MIPKVELVSAKIIKTFYYPRKHSLKIGREFVVKINDVEVEGHYVLTNNQRYRMKLPTGWSKHTDYQEIRLKILELLNILSRQEGSSVMAASYWRKKI